MQSALSLSDFAWLHNAVLLSVTVVLTFGKLAKCAVTVRLCLASQCSPPFCHCGADLRYAGKVRCHCQTLPGFRMQHCDGQLSAVDSRCVCEVLVLGIGSAPLSKVRNIAMLVWRP